VINKRLVFVLIVEVSIIAISIVIDCLS